MPSLNEGLQQHPHGCTRNGLARKPRRRRTGAKLSDRREPYGMAVPLSTGDRKALEERAEAELRSLSNYVATLIAEELG